MREDKILGSRLRFEGGISNKGLMLGGLVRGIGLYLHLNKQSTRERWAKRGKKVDWRLKIGWTMWRKMMEDGRWKMEDWRLPPSILTKQPNCSIMSMSEIWRSLFLSLVIVNYLVNHHISRHDQGDEIAAGTSNFKGQWMGALSKQPLGTKMGHYVSYHSHLLRVCDPLHDRR